MLKPVKLSGYGERWSLQVEIDLEHLDAEISKSCDLKKDRDYRKDDYDGTILRTIHATLEEWDTVKNSWRA